jgi:hypothetical protein
MTKSRKWAVIIFTLFIILWALNALLFSWVVPQTAAFTIPRKWSLIPLRQSKTIVHGYLGEPSVAPGPDTTSEIWASGSKGKMYYLHIHYHADTIATDYSIRYQYRNWLVSRNYLIDSVSIR